MGFPNDLKMFVQFETKAHRSPQCTQFKWTQRNGKKQKRDVEMSIVPSTTARKETNSGALLYLEKVLKDCHSSGWLHLTGRNWFLQEMNLSLMKGKPQIWDASNMGQIAKWNIQKVEKCHDNFSSIVLPVIRLNSHSHFLHFLLVFFWMPVEIPWKNIRTVCFTTLPMSPFLLQKPSALFPCSLVGLEKTSLKHAKRRPLILENQGTTWHYHLPWMLQHNPWCLIFVVQRWRTITRNNTFCYILCSEYE